MRWPAWLRHPAWRRVRNVTGQVLLTLLAVMGLFCLVITALAIVFGLTPFIDVTASMEPAIPDKSLILAQSRPADQARPGDIVGVEVNGVVIIHRVVRATPKGGGLVSLELKGDATPVADPLPYLVSEIHHPVAIMPVPGRIVYVLLTFPGTFGLGTLFGVMITLGFVRWSRRRDKANGKVQGKAREKPGPGEAGGEPA